MVRVGIEMSALLRDEPRGISYSPTLEARTGVQKVSTSFLESRLLDITNDDEDPIVRSLTKDIASGMEPESWLVLRQYLLESQRGAELAIKPLIKHWSFPPPLVRCWKPKCSSPNTALCSDESLDKSSTGEMPGAFFQRLESVLATPPPGGLCLVSTYSKILASLVANTMRLERSKLIVPSWEVIRHSVQKRFKLPSAGYKDGNLDPNQDNDHIILTWQGAAPNLSSDYQSFLRSFVSERWNRPPAYSFADIRLRWDDRQATAELIILFGDKQALSLFSKFRSPESVYHTAQPESQQTWTQTTEIIFSICAVLHTLCEESVDFLRTCSDGLAELGHKARRNPTEAKAKYLIHLSDCRLFASSGINHALEVLDTLEQWQREKNVPQSSWDAGKSFEQRFKDLRLDLQQLTRDLTVVEAQISYIQATLREHMEFSRSRYNTLFVLFSYFYVPFALVTSIFGMNITNPSSTEPVTFPNSTQAFINGTTGDLRNSTLALASTIADSGPLTYSWSSFGATVIFLVLTIIVLINIVNIARGIANFIRTHPSLSELIIWTVYFFCSVFSMMVYAYTTVGYGLLFECVCLVYYGSNLINIVASAGMLWRASKKAHRVMFWSITLGLFILTLIIETILLKVLSRWYFPPMLIPWLWLAYGFVMHPWWKAAKLLKLSKTNQSVDSTTEIPPGTTLTAAPADPGIAGETN